MNDTLPPIDQSEYEILFDGPSYAERLQYFGEKADTALIRSGTFILVGHGWTPSR